MKITRLKKISKKFREFKRRQWEHIHPEHYGTSLDWNYWKMKELLLEAKEGKQIVGVLAGELTAGILFIDELVVGQQKRGAGIGGKLLAEAEKWAKEHRSHGIYLFTGKDWKAVGFYKALGYKKETELPKFYSKTDFLLMRKSL